MKTNRRDAVSLAKLLRAAELTAVWVPDDRHEAMRASENSTGDRVKRGGITDGRGRDEDCSPPL